MTPADHDPLWSRLLGFDFDTTGDALTFTGRLARENGWRPAHARRVVEEYRRFLYLAVRAGHPVTPSDAVDQAWHLHLIYSRSYWDDLCAQVLQRPLHHGPTRGGRSEDDRFLADYEATRASYRRCFGVEPPADLWPEPAIRFAPTARWQRVDVSASWLLPKRALRRTCLGWLGLVGLSGAAMGCSGVVDGDGIPIGVWIMAGILAAGAGLGWLILRTARGGKPGNGSSPTGGSGCGGGVGAGCGGDAGGGHPDAGSGATDGGSSGCGSSGCGGGGCGGS